LQRFIVDHCFPRAVDERVLQCQFGTVEHFRGVLSALLCQGHADGKAQVGLFVAEGEGVPGDRLVEA